VIVDLLPGRNPTAAERMVDQPELQKGRVLDQFLHALRIVDARQLNDDPVAVQSLALDYRLGHTELIDPIPDRLHRLHDGQVANLLEVGVLHLENNGLAEATPNPTWKVKLHYFLQPLVSV
jgi:hypothetical protein